MELNILAGLCHKWEREWLRRQEREQLHILVAWLRKRALWLRKRERGQLHRQEMGQIHRQETLLLHIPVALHHMQQMERRRIPEELLRTQKDCTAGHHNQLKVFRILAVDIHNHSPAFHTLEAAKRCAETPLPHPLLASASSAY